MASNFSITEELEIQEANKYLVYIIQELIAYSYEDFLSFNEERADILNSNFDYDIFKAGRKLADRFGVTEGITKNKLTHLFATATIGEVIFGVEDFAIVDINKGKFNIGCTVRYDFWFKNIRTDVNYVFSVARTKKYGWKIFQTMKFNELNELNYRQLKWFQGAFLKEFTDIYGSRGIPLIYKIVFVAITLFIIFKIVF